MSGDSDALGSNSEPVDIAPGLASVVVAASRLRTNTSGMPLVSKATKSLAALEKAI
jgi:hypothetical protein